MSHPVVLNHLWDVNHLLGVVVAQARKLGKGENLEAEIRGTEIEIAVVIDNVVVYQDQVQVVQAEEMAALPLVFLFHAASITHREAVTRVISVRFFMIEQTIPTI
eukprot:m.60732 g.60732  ORF g.60732 m.60732 type:complete len:105 (-) comp11833_c1_seq1:336-650(-)